MILILYHSVDYTTYPFIFIFQNQNKFGAIQIICEALGGRGFIQSDTKFHMGREGVGKSVK
jgi:hypothetical protein